MGRHTLEDAPCGCSVACVENDSLPGNRRIFGGMDKATLLQVAGHISSGTGLSVRWVSPASPTGEAFDGLGLSLLRLHPNSAHRIGRESDPSQPLRVSATLMLSAHAPRHEDAIQQLMVVIAWLAQTSPLSTEGGMMALRQIPADLEWQGAWGRSALLAGQPFILLDWEGPCFPLASGEWKEE